MPILNRLGFTQKMGGGVHIGTAQPVEVVDAGERRAESTQGMANPIGGGDGGTTPPLFGTLFARDRDTLIEQSGAGYSKATYC